MQFECLADSLGASSAYGKAEQHGKMPPRSGWRIPHDELPKTDISLIMQGQKEEQDMSLAKRLEIEHLRDEAAEAALAAAAVDPTALAAASAAALAAVAASDAIPATADDAEEVGRTQYCSRCSCEGCTAKRQKL